jgi:hypothetical protein
MIVNSGFEFSPDDIEINLGDTVVFQLASSHNAVEVSLATWNANGNTPLPGFSVPFGGGMVTGLTAGVHYYVCAPHASGGMKGKITVNAPSGIPAELAFDRVFKLFPNPSGGFVNIGLKNGGTAGLQLRQGIDLEIVNMAGQPVYTMTNIDIYNDGRIDITAFPTGRYILVLKQEDRRFTSLLIKE